MCKSSHSYFTTWAFIAIGTDTCWTHSHLHPLMPSQSPATDPRSVAAPGRMTSRRPAGTAVTPPARRRPISAQLTGPAPQAGPRSRIAPWTGSSTQARYRPDPYRMMYVWYLELSREPKHAAQQMRYQNVYLSNGHCLGTIIIF